MFDCVCVWCYLRMYSVVNYTGYVTYGMQENKLFIRNQAQTPKEC